MILRGVEWFVENKLRAVEAKITEIGARYDIASADETEARYRAGTLPEADTWQDYQQLDDLAYERERLQELKQMFVGVAANGAS